MQFRRNSRFDSRKLIFELNLTGYCRGDVTDTAASAATEAIGPEFFTLCSNTKTRPPLPTAYGCLGLSGSAIGDRWTFAPWLTQPVQCPSCRLPMSNGGHSAARRRL